MRSEVALGGTEVTVLLREADPFLIERVGLGITEQETKGQLMSTWRECITRKASKMQLEHRYINNSNS